MGTFHVVNPSQESDLFKHMRRFDLYQFADIHGVDYPKDAAAEVMKNLLRGSGKTPSRNDFVFQHDEKGNVLGAIYRRLPREQAPRSRHADADDAQSLKVAQERWRELDDLTDTRLKTMVKNQKGRKALDNEPSRDEMISLLGGVKPEGDGGSVLQQLDDPTPVEPQAKDNPVGIPAWLLESQTPMQLVKICKEMGIPATIKDGKVALLERIRSHG